MPDESKVISLTSPDGIFPPATIRELHQRRWAHAQRGTVACSVEHLGVNKYHVTVSVVNSDHVLEVAFTDFDGMVTLITRYGFNLE